MKRPRKPKLERGGAWCRENAPDPDLLRRIVPTAKELLSYAFHNYKE